MQEYTENLEVQSTASYENMQQVKEETKEWFDLESKYIDATSIQEDKKELFTLLQVAPEDQIKNELCQAKREIEEINEIRLEDPLTGDVSIDEKPVTRPLLDSPPILKIEHEEASIADARISTNIEEWVTAQNTELIEERNYANQEPSILSNVATRTKNFNFLIENETMYSMSGNNNSFVPKICTTTFTIDCDVAQHELIQNSDIVDNSLHYKVFDQSLYSKNSTTQLVVASVTGEENSCKLQSKSFSDSLGLIYHKRTHKGHCLFSCNVCSKSFSYNNDLQSHILSHTDERRYLCSICSRSFGDSNYFKIHIRTHTGERPFSCNVCCESFCDIGGLKYHLRTNRGHRIFSCHICSKSFSRKSLLHIHIRSHTGERPFSCDICNKSFLSKSNLPRHMRRHTGERPFSCNVCNKSFSRKASLKAHMCTHTGSRPFSCQVCSKSFSEKRVLKSHMRTHMQSSFSMQNLQ